MHRRRQEWGNAPGGKHPRGQCEGPGTPEQSPLSLGANYPLPPQHSVAHKNKTQLVRLSSFTAKTERLNTNAKYKKIL